MPLNWGKNTLEEQREKYLETLRRFPLQQRGCLDVDDRYKLLELG